MAVRALGVPHTGNNRTDTADGTFYATYRTYYTADGTFYATYRTHYTTDGAAYTAYGSAYYAAH